MRKFLLVGLVALLLLGGAVALIWRLDGAAIKPSTGTAVEAAPGPVPAAIEAPPPAPPAPEVAPTPPPLPDEPSVLHPRQASDRDPRNDVQRPADPRADLMVEERAAVKERAIDQLNRRAARRKEEMKAFGEIRPSAPAVPPSRP